MSGYELFYVILGLGAIAIFLTIKYKVTFADFFSSSEDKKVKRK